MAAEAMKAAKVCAEKRELLAAYENSVREVMALQSQQLGALAGNGEAIERFELEIERARKNRDHAKEVYRLHIQSHGC